MSKFERRFAVENLAKWDREHPGNAVRALFDRWSLPGEQVGPARRLRLAVRNGYLNLYIKGQSVAKLTCGPNGPTLSLHNAYANQIRRGEGDGPLTGQKTYDSQALATAAVAACVDTWIDIAETYSSAEKRFVDDLISLNAGAIDLEMALPASAGGDRVAPRMDLVVAQRSDDLTLAIGFWEAKCANNPELRASGESVPKVVRQLEKYTKWLATGDRQTEVQQAYRQTAQILLGLYGLYRGKGNDEDCLAYWHALADLERPQVTPEAGLVIGNYWAPAQNDLSEREGFARSAVTFVSNGHREKLERKNILVCEVGPDHAAHRLPILSTTSR